ncbi:UDP-N-acetylglucosamine 4,6-dehydratase (configuration-retaining) [Arcobacter cryaerophilus gv. pseudocryaerophilus]|uniref:UDP-N-acetylglucosamine 4,6-dehydratase (Configuration-retaining) n=4 Tax=Arcobacteraceae TaxID=2808963 RepID=A0AA96IFC9_9BACT|nr:UDP-N-acetylglucosamine 4,6-dehydratase (configuration-retaining) [Arcobacter sp. AZ-2023]WPD05169.1 UDP-N-acetylglucosamine 4,6-dehydratase (configuration-retaining) [Arcobacter sp. DSM 115956]WPD07263.1 UDP-N-acetylglucosamine 4,6-dehydratase (configuration-retaining) [Arcobacter sp. DSM 115955]WNL31528.1 UDP-N-acetylglucosamine 4,6-dehydratase (configuration-retaining) [Arcobacter sp. AZ-2023]WNP37678.1 UDP-N-acetylglucosamine 4,6-dehydratase (configuration-retaining) [Arcobacter sp. AZ-2
MIKIIDKRFLGVVVNIAVSIFSLYLVAFLLNKELSINILAVVIGFRILASFLLFDDYKLSWSKASTKTGLMKIVLALLAFAIYTPILYYFYSVPFNLLFIDVVFYTFMINILVYVYKYFYSIKGNKKTKSLVIYGAGKAGLQLQREFLSSEYKLICFIDDDEILHHRSIDGISIFSREKYSLNYKNRFDLMIIAMPSASQEQIKSIYESMQDKFEKIKILPSMQNILKKELFVKQLKDIGVEDLLARYPKDLDKNAIQNFIKDKIVLITGAGGSIGSEISRQCKAYGAKQLILVDHSEFNLYSILEELQDENIIPIMQSVKDIDILESTFSKYRPQIVIHAAAYKHVPLVEHNILEGITNNIIGTKNTIDLSIKYKVEKFVLISTDKAVRPTNVMGTTKRVCELYAQNVDSKNTEIVAVRFGNVLGSSGSVIPKFKAQIEAGKNITVTHPEITRYFMLIPEACELVLQAASIGKGGEIFILDMGEPIKIVDLAKKMIELSGRSEIGIEFCGLRCGEKLYEELLIDDSDKKTQYESITVASPTFFDIEELNKKIEELLVCEDKISKLKEIVPEFDHRLN